MGFLKKTQSENPGDEASVGDVDDGFVDVPADDVAAADSAPRDSLKDKGQAGNESEAAPEDVIAPAESLGDQAGQDDLMDGLPSSVYLLREILRNHDWSENPADPAGQMIEWTMIESMIRSAIDAGHRGYVEQVWAEVAPSGHGGLADVLASLPQDAAEPAGPEVSQPAQDEVHEAELGVEPHLHTYQMPEADRLPEPYLRTISPDDMLDGQYRHIPDEEFSKAYQGQEWATRPEAVRPAPAADPASSHPEGAAAAAGTDLLSKALSAPFALASAAGSLVLGSLKTMGDQARSFYQKRAVNGHQIMERQLNEHATRIDGLTSRLRQSGMAEFITELKATGRPANEIFDGMKPGGPYERFGRRFSSLMEDADFASAYAKLQRHMDDFGDLASRYAKAGVDLNLDYSDAVDRNLSKISAATEGFPGMKDGAFKHLQEMAQQIGERIKRLVDRLMGRLAPQ
ncbi:hypothetical protein [Ectopseudomonas hydrolytica]|uniref:hypothetical protein n=1 Tax=Ectopseudomonas hydrolytica TaxID=2493633 RepID=UPI001A186390|nr:hypothetical protein [Pseudomonas aeruginosa]MBH4099543.1 hypothetical protein [Pseudomonas aeruginosa]